MSGAVALLIFLLALPACYAANYVVGDTTGWDTSGDYSTWASGKTFSIGDTLLFVYGASHSVDEVNKADYDSCSATNAISSASDGNTTINLTKTGLHYFICATPNHCSQGMKLAVTVSAASSPAPAGSAPAPSKTPSPVSSVAPSPHSSSSPSSTPSPDATPSDLTPPTSSKTPTTSTPTGNGAMGSFKRMDALVFGASLIFGLLLVLMG